eukprot:1157356-Pelagomonas_calceolata.AAC.4
MSTQSHICESGPSQTKAKSLAFKLRDNAIQRSTTIINTRHALCFHGGFWDGGCARCAAVEDGKSRVRASGSMASNPPDPY